MSPLRRGHDAEIGHGRALLEHDPEKWRPVFRKDHAQTKGQSGMTIQRKVILHEQLAQTAA
jgi:hypothetical protein